MKATEDLIKDHKMIRKVLENFQVDNPRYGELLKTLQRIVLAHAWFEDEIFLPAFRGKPLLKERFINEIYQEHKDIGFLLSGLRKTAPDQKRDIDATSLQLTAVLRTHLNKEEEALFPIAEKVLDNEGLNQLSQEMKRRQTEVRNLAKE